MIVLAWTAIASNQDRPLDVPASEGDGDLDIIVNVDHQVRRGLGRFVAKRKRCQRQERRQK